MVAASTTLEREDHQRDAEFNKALHGKSAQAAPGMAAMLSKNQDAKKVAVEEYFKHFDGKRAEDDTAEQRAARTKEYATLTRQYVFANAPTRWLVRVSHVLICALLRSHSYYNLATDLYEYGWGQSFHFCRFSHGEAFYQAIARHEHYLASQICIKKGMKVLDVGCGVGGPAREIAKFTDAHITGLNNNDYQIERATHYAAKEGLSNQLKFVKGDFMVCQLTLLRLSTSTDSHISKCISRITLLTPFMLSRQLCTPRSWRVSTARSSGCSSPAVSLACTSGS